jgi:hypothetical protein
MMLNTAEGKTQRKAMAKMLAPVIVKIARATTQVLESRTVMTAKGNAACDTLGDLVAFRDWLVRLTASRPNADGNAALLLLLP